MAIPLAPAKSIQTEELTREQILEILELGAQNRRGISAGDMLAAYRRGQLDDPGELSDLLMIALLLSDDDPVWGE